MGRKYSDHHWLLVCLLGFLSSISLSAFGITEQVRVSAGNDDAEELILLGSMTRNSSDLTLGYSAASADLQTVGMRFRGLDVPQGATINFAYLEFESASADIGAANFLIYGEDEDTVNQFANNDGNISGRTKTTELVSWTPGSWNSVGSSYQSADITAVIQEIINRSGWSAGNHVAIIIEAGSSCLADLCQRKVVAHNGASGSAPLLVVDYTVAATQLSVSTQSVSQDYDVDGYGGSQDNAGTVAIRDVGLSLFLEGNRWQKIDFPYTVTEDTVIEFDFQSTNQGEIHGLGFDDDLGISSNRSFRVYGTQNWGISDFDTYSGSGVTHFTIPVGQFYTGNFQYLFFMNDDDSNPTGNSLYSNINVYEIGADVVPVAEYRFDEVSWSGSSADVLDSSGNTLHGTATNVQPVSGLVCNAADFTGSNFIQVANNSLLEVGKNNSDYTINFWVQLSATQSNGWRSITHKGNVDSERTFAAWLRPNGDNRVHHRVSTSSSSNEGHDSVTAIPADSWTMVSMVKEGDTLKTYFNGNLDRETTLNGDSVDNTGSLYLGKDPWYNGMTGLMDEYLVFANALSITDIQEIHTNQLAGNGWDGATRTCPEVVMPVLEYRFDEESWNGTTDEVVDNSSNGLNGSAAGNTTTISEGQICSAGTFDGTGDYIDVAGINSYLNTTASLSFWIKSSQQGNNSPWRAPGIIGVEEGGGGDDIFWGYLDGSGRIGIQKGNGSSAFSTAALNDVNWQHVVLTYDSSNGAVQVFVDGSLEASATSESGDVSNVFSSIGRIENSSGLNFTGQLDELLVFDYVLSASDVSSIYTNQNAGNNWDGGVRTCPVLQCPSGTSGLLNAVGIKIDNTQINTTTEALNIYNAWLAAGSPASGSIDSGAYNVAASGSSTADRIDFGGSAHDFSGTLAYPGAGAGVSGSDFLVHASGTVSLSAGDYTIYVEADDGFSFTMDTLSGDTVSFNKFGSSTSGVSNELRFENPTGNSNTGGSFTLTQDSVFDVAAIFFERGGGDYLEISIANDIRTSAAPAGYEILRDGALSGKVTIGQCLDVSGPDHYAISHSAVGVTCEGALITVTAHDASHADFAVSSDTVLTVSTSPAVDSIITSPVTMLAGTSTASFYLNQSSALANIDIDVTDGTASDLDDGGAEDELFEFRDTAFRFYADGGNTDGTPIGTQISGKPSNVGSGDQSLTLRAIRTNTDTGACEAALQGTTEVEIAYECNNPTTCTGTNLLTFAGSTTETISRNNNATVAKNYASVDMTFDASGEAPFYMNYFDAGQITLHARKTVAAASPEPAFDLVGQSNAFVVTPFAYHIEVEGEPAATDHLGDAYLRAGTGFDVTLRPVIYESSDNANNNDDLANNALTPNFGRHSAIDLTQGFTLQAPTGIGTSSGVITNWANSTNAFNNSGTFGERLFENITWSEVGIISLNALHSDYLAGGLNIVGTRPNVGRFYPNHFDVTVDSGRFAAACGDFTYIGQNFTYDDVPSLTITAKNSIGAGNTTLNYTHADFIKLKASDITRVFPTADSKLGASGVALSVDTTLFGFETLTVNGGGIMTCG